MNHESEFKSPEDVLVPIKTHRINSVDIETAENSMLLSIVSEEEYHHSFELEYFVEFAYGHDVELYCTSRGVAREGDGEIKIEILDSSIIYYLGANPLKEGDNGSREEMWSYLCSNLDSNYYIDIRVSLSDYMFFYKGNEDSYGYQSFIDIRRLENQIIDRRKDTMYMFNDYSKSGIEALQRMLDNYHYLPHFDELK